MGIVQSILNGDTDVTREGIEQLTGLARDLHRDKSNVVKIPPRSVIFVGDLHGEFESILRVQKLMAKYKTHTFVFLGDYADRGPAQIETINLVMALALEYPERVHLLRGNHESDKVAQKYGFYAEVTSKLSFDAYNKYLEVFQVLPMAAYNSDGVFACHGGIPEGVSSIEEIQKCNRINYDFPNDILFQLAWNDPKEADFRFAANSRGRRVKAFGRKAFNEFSQNLGVKIMLRAHEVFPEGSKKFFDIAGTRNTNDSRNTMKWNMRNSGISGPIGLIRNKPIATRYNTGTATRTLVLKIPAANAPAAVAITVNRPKIAIAGLMNIAINDPIMTAMTPKNGPSKNPSIGADTRPKEISPPPPTAIEYGSSVITRWTAANIPVKAHG